MQKRFHHKERLPITSIIGIDGSGKSTAARLAHENLSSEVPGFAGLEVDRQIHFIHDGNTIPLADEHYDGFAARIDGGNKLAQMYNRARYARAKAQLGRNASRLVTEVHEDPLNLLVNVRDPVIDSYAFAGDRFPKASPLIALRALKRVNGTQEWPDATVWIDVDPEVSLDRIAAAAKEREVFGDQAHENIDTLSRMRSTYARALDVVRRTGGRVVRVDGSRSRENVVADVQNVLADTYMRR